MNKNYSLSTIIFKDLITFHKKQLLLLFIILLSAISTIIIVHKTRLLVTEKEKIDKIKEQVEAKLNILESYSQD